MSLNPSPSDWLYSTGYSMFTIVGVVFAVIDHNFILLPLSSSFRPSILFLLIALYLHLNMCFCVCVTLNVSPKSKPINLLCCYFSIFAFSFSTTLTLIVFGNFFFFFSGRFLRISLISPLCSLLAHSLKGLCFKLFQWSLCPVSMFVSLSLSLYFCLSFCLFCLSVLFCSDQFVSLTLSLSLRSVKCTYVCFLLISLGELFYMKSVSIVKLNIPNNPWELTTTTKQCPLTPHKQWGISCPHGGVWFQGAPFLWKR